MQINEQQARRIAPAMFTQKLAGAMSRAVPEFDELSTESRAEFLEACQRAAAARGLLTEQGIAAYALATWFLGPGFEAKSPYLMALLDSGFPEVRKVHALNEWVHVLLGDPENLAAADEALKAAFYRSAAWGA
jgi:hypothetical protein